MKTQLHELYHQLIQRKIVVLIVQNIAFVNGIDVRFSHQVVGSRFC